MARLLTIGAEYNAGATADLDYDSTSGSTITNDTTTVRSGTYSWKFVCAASGPFLTRQYTPVSNANDGYFRTYLNVTSITTASSISIFTARSAASGNVINMRLTRDSASTYHVALFDEQTSTQIGSNSGTLNTSTWYRLEMSYMRTAGTFSGFIDGIQFATGTGTTLKDLNTLRWGSVDASTMTIFFDDIAVNDNTGTSQTGLPGSGKVIRLLPNAAGDVNTFATQTGGTAGSANNFTRINEVLPDGATTFNGSSTLNQEDLVNFGASGINAADTVNVVEVWAQFRNSTADPTAAIKFEIEKAAAGTILQSAAIVPNSTVFQMNAPAVPKAPPLVTYADPTGAAWTQTTLDSAQAGYKLTTAPGTAGRRIDVTNLSLIVDYTPATNVTATPGTLALTLTTFAPVVTASNNITATPSTTALTLTTFAPTVNIGRTVVPDTAVLTLTTFAPTISVTDNKLIVPPTATLSLTTFAPVVSTPRLVTPPTTALTLTTFAPTVTATHNVLVTPPTTALVITKFAPTITVGKTATPGTLALTLTTFAPTVTVLRKPTTAYSKVAKPQTGFAATIEPTTGYGPTTKPKTAYTGETKPPVAYSKVTKPPTGYI